MGETLRQAIASAALSLLLLLQQGMIPVVDTNNAFTPPTPPLIVQQITQAPATTPLTFPGANTLGNTIVVFIMYGGGASPPTISDSRGNSYSLFSFQTCGTIHGGFAIATNIAAGANTVSTTTIGSGGVYGAFEYSGVTGIETSQPTACQTASTTPPLAIGPITITGHNTLILLGAGTVGSTTITDANGWTSVFGSATDGTFATGRLFSKAPGITGNYSNSLSWTGTPTSQMAGMVGLKGPP